MALPKDYQGQRCSLARSLEVLGERWTLLIVRDAFYGVRRFSDFADHLGIPRSVLAARLEALVGHDVMVKTSPTVHGYAEYALTAKGRELWPAVHALTSWGDAHYAQGGPPWVYEHADDGGPIDADGLCSSCGQRIAPQQLLAVPGPGLAPAGPGPTPSGPGGDIVTAALRRPHRLLEDIRAAESQ